jgi:hypothetical protein
VREHSLSGAIAYDLIPAASPLRALVHWDPLEHFIGEVTLGALNLTAMTGGHVQGWHCDNTDFAVSLAIQSPWCSTLPGARKRGFGRIWREQEEIDER